MEPEIDVKLTLNEIGALQHLIDLGVRSAGMQVAEAGVVLTKKLNGFAQAQQQMATQVQQRRPAPVDRLPPELPPELAAPPASNPGG